MGSTEIIALLLRWLLLLLSIITDSTEEKLRKPGYSGAHVSTKSSQQKRKRRAGGISSAELAHPTAGLSNRRLRLPHRSRELRSQSNDGGALCGGATLAEALGRLRPRIVARSRGAAAHGRQPRVGRRAVGEAGKVTERRDGARRDVAGMTVWRGCWCDDECVQVMTWWAAIFSDGVVVGTFMWWGWCHKGDTNTWSTDSY